MPITKSRQIAKILKLDGTVKDSLYDSDAIVTSAQLGVTPAAGTAVYSSADTLPASATNGDQALVSSTNRLYIFTNGGWYNIALINNTPYWSTEAASSYDLSTTGATTTITILAVDSEGINPVYTATADSDFNQIATITKDSDSGRTFTITPADSEGGTAVTGSGTVTFKASDGVNLVSTLSTFNLTFITIISNSNYTTLLLQADTAGTDNQVDASTSARTITEAGNVTSTAFTPYHPGGYSTYMDGGDGYGGFGDGIYVADSTDFDFGTGDFTMEGWYYATDVTSDRYLINFNTNTPNGHFGVNFYNGAWRVGLFNGSLITGTTGIETNVWHHFAWVRESGVMKFYIDGTQVGSDLTYSGALDSNGQGGHGVVIGAWATISYAEFSGYLRDIRVVKGTAVYTSAFTPPTEPLTAITNTVLLTCHLPYIADGSTSSHVLTSGGGDSLSTERFGPYDHLSYTKTDYGGSVYFDGTNDNLSMASSADFNFGSDDWTIEAWLYQTARDGSNVCRWYMSGTNGDGNAIHVSINTNGTLDCGRATGGGVITGSSTATVLLNTWNHVVATKEGSNGYLYLNGKQVSTSGSATAQTSGDISLRIGYDTVNTVNEQFTGYMSDLQIIKGRRKYKAAFTPPTLPMTADSDAVLFTCTNKNDIWDAGGEKVIKANQATASNAQRKFTTSSSIYFDGTTDYVYIDWQENNNLKSTVPFTIEGWFYFDTVASDQHFIQAYENGGGYDGFALALGAASLGFTTLVFWDGATWRAFKSDMAADTWYHIAVVNDATASNNTKVYVDGTQSGSAFTVSSQISRPSSVPISIGCYYASTQAMDGYVQDVRITNGLARYTAAFTPPTSTFKG